MKNGRKRRGFKNIIQTLTPTAEERKIITDRFIMGKTQREIADEIGISKAQVSRIEKSGLNNIKRKIL